MTKKEMIRVAKLEMQEWKPGRMPPGIVLAILFCFIHRLSTGETVEETFFKPAAAPVDYEI